MASVMCQAVYAIAVVHVGRHTQGWPWIVSLTLVVVLAPLVYVVLDDVTNDDILSWNVLGCGLLIVGGLVGHRIAQGKRKELRYIVDDEEHEYGYDSEDDDDDANDETADWLWGPVPHQTSYTLLREPPAMQSGDV